MKKQIIFIAAFFFFIGCLNNGNGKLENEIATSIKKNCKSENCQVDISQLTTFRWSKLYVFRETASLEVVEQILNQKYPYYVDVARRLVFTDNTNKVIYHEDVFPNVEGVKNQEVIFLMPDTITHRIFANPIFTVTKQKIVDGEYYVLNQLWTSEKSKK